MKFLCDQCKAKYQIADEKVQGKTLRMKCRKCGHVIEIRASVETTSTGETVQLAALSEEAAAAALAQSVPPPAAKAAPTPAPRPAAAPAPRPGAAPRAGAPSATTPRPAAAATRPAAGAPAPKQAPRAADGAKSTAPSGALASAFSKQVATTTKVEAPQAAAPTGPEVPPEEWYVAIEEVPVGPIRLSELRAKYAQGAVTDDSLVWREGYEEWRPLRTLADLHSVVREEVSGAHAPGRGSLLPNAAGAAARPAARPSGPAAGAKATSSPRPATAAARGGNVIPFVQPRGAAAARKLDEDFDDEATQIAASPVLPPEPAPPVSAPQAKVVDDPFAVGAAAPSVAAPTAASTPAVVSPAAHAEDVGRPTIAARARGLSKGTVALIAAACVLLGVVVAVVAVKPKVVEKVVEKRVDVPVSVFVPVAGQAAAAPTVAVVEPETSATAPKVAAKSGAPSVATTAAPTTTAGSKKLGGLDMGPEGPSVGGPGGSSGGSGQPLEGKAVETVVASKRVSVRKVCFEPWSDKGNASVKITLKIGPDGRVQSSDIASSSGEPAVGQCVQRLSKGWTFPSSESGGTFNVPFLFGT